MNGKDRRCVLYVAMSLDGYIADENGSVAWLDEFQGKGEDFGYSRFLDAVDTLVMGRITYEQLLTFGDWPYTGKRTIVLSHMKLPMRDGVEFTSLNVDSVMDNIRRTPGKDIWLVGGGKLIRSFLEAGLIDVHIISVMPRLLGRGIPLFGGGYQKAKLELVKMKKIEDVAQLEYRTIR